jgi:hypothetical protein
VEIMVAVLQKKRKNKKKKESMMKKIDYDDGEDDDGEDDADIPHQIRGNVIGFSQIMLKASAIHYTI